MRPNQLLLQGRERKKKNPVPLVFSTGSGPQDQKTLGFSPKLAAAALGMEAGSRGRRRRATQVSGILGVRQPLDKGGGNGASTQPGPAGVWTPGLSTPRGRAGEPGGGRGTPGAAPGCTAPISAPPRPQPQPPGPRAEPPGRSRTKAEGKGVETGEGGGGPGAAQTMGAPRAAWPPLPRL